MIRLAIGLPAIHRRMIKLIKSRVRMEDDPLLPSLGEILRAKKGSRISRYFRHVFEHKRIRRVLGTNIAFLVISTALLPTNQSVDSSLFINADTTVTSPIVLTTEIGARFPVKTVSITQSYNFYHPGLDLDGVTGDPIYPILDGTVISVEYSKFAYGNSVIVDHGNGLKSLYAHLSVIEVSVGDNVVHEKRIGKMGATGRAFGDHLHMEIYENGRAINPLTLIPR
jgi:murein DD-endopeptidase MepM/ murein hydrolase activator NlpD